jgi:DNA-binding response OmpR family regulator
MRKKEKGMITIDRKRFTVTADGKDVHLTPKEWKLLGHLMDADGVPVTRERLLKLVWRVAPNSGVETRTVDQHIARLRGKLGRHAIRVRTLSTRGYQWI